MANNVNNGITGVIDIPGALRSRGAADGNLVGGVVAYAGDIYDTTAGKNQAAINEEFDDKLQQTELCIDISNYIRIQGGAYEWVLISGNYLDGYYITEEDLNKGSALASLLSDCDLLDTTTLEKVAKIRYANYISNTEKIEFSLDADLGELDGDSFCIENINAVQNTWSFGIGYFGNNAMYSNLVGFRNYNTGSISTLLGYNNLNTKSRSDIVGSNNVNAKQNSVIFGDTNTNDGTYSNIIGNRNTNSASAGSVLGYQNSVSADSSLAYTSVIGGLNTVNSGGVILGIQNTTDCVGSTYILGRQNTVNVPNTGVDTTVLLGQHLSVTNSGGGLYIGRYNKEYAGPSLDLMNYFAIGGGSSDLSRRNLLEIKRNGEVFISDIGGFDGTNSTVTGIKSLQDALSDIENSSSSSAAAAAQSASTASGYYSDILTAMGSLGSGEAVAAQVALNQADIAGLKSNIVVDLSARYTASYANLSAALTALNSDAATDASAIKKAGVSIKFINSTTNKYEQWSLKASSWSTATSNWVKAVDSADIPIDKIESGSTQSEEEAIVFTTDGGVEVGKIDSTGADFTNLKRGGQQVARMSDLPTVPIISTDISADASSNTKTASPKAVKDYVDAHQTDLPITKQSTQYETEEMEFGNDAGNQSYAKVGDYGIKSKAYLDMSGNSAIPAKDTTIGSTPSQTNVPTSKAVVDYVEDYIDKHAGGVGDLPITQEKIVSSDEEIIFTNDAGTQQFAKITPEGIRAISYKDMQGNPIGGSSIGNVLYGKKWVACGDSYTEGDFRGIADSTKYLFQDGVYANKKKVYPYLIGLRNNMTIINDGKSGSIMALDKSYLEDPDHVSIDLRNPFSLNRYKEVAVDADYITIWFGINDEAHCNLGTINDTDNTTVYGAWNVVLEYYLRFRPYAKIGIIISNGTIGDTMRGAVKDIAKKWGIPYLDLMEDDSLSCGINKKNMDSFALELRTTNRYVSQFIKCKEANSDVTFNIAHWDNIDWLSGGSYSVGDIAVYQHFLYKCTTANSDTTFDYTKWQMMVWQAGNTYVAGDVVTHNNKAYRCTSANSDNSWTSGHWSLLSWVSGTSYAVGDLAMFNNGHPSPETHLFESYMIENFLRTL